MLAWWAKLSDAERRMALYSQSKDLRSVDSGEFAQALRALNSTQSQHNVLWRYDAGIPPPAGLTGRLLAFCFPSGRGSARSSPVRSAVSPDRA
jgi:hypothetical protein